MLSAPLTTHAAPKIEHWTLANGARVYFVAAHEIPMLQVRAVFDAGSARDAKDKGGLARMTNRLLHEGAADMTGDAIAERFENLGAEFGAAAERDMATVDLRSLNDSKLLEPAFGLLADVLTRPTFPAASLERERQRTLVGLAHDTQSPGSVARKAYMRALYGEHPYAADPSGDQDSLKRLTRDDLLAFHKRYYVGSNVWFVMIGDISSAQAHRVAERLVGALPAGEPTSVLPTVKPLVYPHITHLRFPASQSHLLVGEPGITRDDPDYFALYVGNHILGGNGLISRLADEVREKRGLAYSVYSGFSPMRAPGPFTMSLQTKNATRDQALNLLRATLEEFTQQGPTEKELVAAKQNIIGGFALRLDSNQKIADQLASIAFYGLPLDYLETFSARVQAVTAEQVRDAFTRRVRPDQLTTVMVGGES